MNIFPTKVALLSLYFLTSLGPVLAQNTSDWIDFGNEYYKVTLAAEGAYRMTYSDLQDVGFPVNSVDPRRIQLFHRGVEQAIIVQGQADAQFNVSDYIEFYGKKNDGTNDSKLYISPGNQPHNYYNLYSDTSAYFLTWSQGLEQGKRMANFSEVNVGAIPAETFHYNTNLTVYANEYSTGNTVSTVLQYTQFDEGEGWTGSTICIGNSGCTGQMDYSITNLTGPVVSGGDPQLELLLVGRDAVNHLSEVYVGPNGGSLRLLTTESFVNYQTVKVNLPILWSDISAGGQLTVRIKALGVGGLRDRISVSYIKVGHPQDFNMNLQPSKWFQLEENPGNKSYIELTNPPVALSIWDVTDPSNIVTIGTAVSGPNISAVVPNTGVSRLLFAKNGYFTPDIHKIKFRQIIPTNHNYLIISHKSLMKPALEYSDPVRSYGAYRASPEGGDYDTLVVTSDLLFDQFNYGESSPVAIYEFMKFMVQNGDPSYLFLIGKGLNVSQGFFRKTVFGPNDFRDLVPSAGMPGSDMAFTAGLNGTTFEPAVPTGRITASTPLQVAAYLNKVKETESLAFDVLWRKEVLHLSGGIQPEELIAFRQYMDGFAEVAKGPYYGGSVKTIAKQEPNPVELINVSEEVNEGVNLITFFGHSSPSTIDIDIGFVTDPVLGYNNPGKYPGFIINGCNAGAFYSNSTVFGEDWILATNKGARSFIAHSSFGFNSTLRTYTQLFYETGFGDSTYVRTGVGDIQKEVAKRYLALSSPNISTVTQIQQMVLLGDPAVKLFGAAKPDYETNDTALYLESFDENPVTALADSFAVKIITSNFGSSSKLPLAVRITRTFNDNSTKTYDSVFTSTGSLDTITFVLKKEVGLSGFGSNQFYVELDFENNIDELNEENNTGLLNLFIPLSGTKNLVPYPFGIVNTTNILLKFQNTNLISELRSYDLQVDTTDTFNSPYFQQYTMEGKVLMEKSIEILDIDSLAYYWRTRLSDPQAGENTEWSSTSFTYIENGEEGWAQVHFPQLSDNSVQGLVKDPVLRQLNFEETTVAVQVNNFGSAFPSPPPTSFRINNEEYNLATQGQPCRINTINFVAFDKTSLVPYAGIPFIFQDPRTCGRSPQVINSFRLTEMETGNNDDIIQMIDNIQLSDSVVVFSIGNAGYESWTPNVISKLEELGIGPTQLSLLQSGAPVVIFSKKGASSGSASLITTNDTPANEQELLVSESLTGKYTSGTMSSPIIGPADNWSKFTAYVREISLSDEYSFDISGIKLDGGEQLLFDDIMGTMDISSVNANEFPWLRFELKTTDEVEQNPVQVYQWIVNYTPRAEGILLFDGDADPVDRQEGEPWTGEYSFVNISDKLFPDQLSVDFETLNKESRDIETQSQNITAPLPGDSTRFTFTVDTYSKAGFNDVSVVVNNRIVPEQFYENNTLTLIDYLNVIPDRIDPVLDVTIDGRYIMQGDFVSSTPSIIVKIWDESQLVLKTDTLGIQLFLKYPCEEGTCDFTPIYFSRADVSWTPASSSDDFMIEFLPDLGEGSYTLRVEVEDGSGNKSVAPYQISFNVNFENQIQFRDPYPNPSHDEVYFSIIVSGQQAPSGYTLQIFGMDGQLIKNYESEDASLHVGSNIISWNGENDLYEVQNGGLYLYRITIVSAGQTFSRNGKIILLK